MDEKPVDKDPGRADYVPKGEDNKVRKLLRFCCIGMELIKLICSMSAGLKMETACGCKCRHPKIK
jgi:hypothetical protein